MKLALINTPCEATTVKYYPPLGICYIATYIEKYLEENINIVAIDGLFEDIINAVKKENPDLVGISSTTLEFSNAMKMAQVIKKHFSVPIICGGVHISALPNTLPKCFDIGVIGEGEQTTLELVQLFLRHQDFPVILDFRSYIN